MGRNKFHPYHIGRAYGTYDSPFMLFADKNLRFRCTQSAVGTTDMVGMEFIPSQAGNVDIINF